MLFSKYNEAHFLQILSNEDPLRRTQWCAHAGTLAQTYAHMPSLTVSHKESGQDRFQATD